MKEQFLNQYNKVFLNDEVTPCGRDACKKLIILANQISEKPMNFGDENTGLMNVENIIALKNSL